MNFWQFNSVNCMLFKCLYFVSVFKILERQSKFQRKKTKDEKVDDSDAEEPGGLFDD